MRYPIQTTLQTSRPNIIATILAAVVVTAATGMAFGEPVNRGKAHAEHARVYGPRIVGYPKLNTVRPGPLNGLYRLQRIPAVGVYNVSPSSPQAVSLIGQMLRAESSMNMYGTQVTQVTRNGRVIESVQYLAREGDRALRMDYIEPDRLAGVKVVDDGTTRWRYSPKQNTLQVGPSTIARLDGRIKQLMNHLHRQTFAMNVVGSDNVAGHACTIVEVDSLTNPPVVTRRFWIDPDNGAQLRIQEFDALGQLQSDSYFTAVTYNAALNASLFTQPQTPQNVRVDSRPVAHSMSSLQQAEAQAGFSTLQPTYLPQGFTFQSASVMKDGNIKIVGLKYVNGVNVLSLFETPERSQPIENVQHPRPGVAQATVAGFHIIVVGNATPADLDQMVNSLH
jgi:negative regulator of sigma E activity